MIRWRKIFRPQPVQMVTEGMQRLTFNRRVLVVGGAQALVGAALAVRMGWISIVDGSQYRLKAESNRVNLTLIPPRRGWIVDRYGKALADNRVALRVDIIPDRLHNRAATLGRLAQILSLDADTLDRVNRALDANHGAQPVEVLSDLDEARFAAVSVHLPELPGVSPTRGFTRNYPTGPSVAHLINYIGAPSAEEYAKDRNPLMLTPGFKMGKDGIEKYFDRELRGRPGARRAEVTARGRLVRELDTLPDRPGAPLQMTIDADLQDYASRRLGVESGACVVIDCLTGGILTMTSMPAFDPNSFTDGIGRLEWKMLNEDDHIPLLNKAVRGLYPPGSTLKPMAAVALQLAGVDPDETVSCGGGYRLGGRLFRCLGVHGPVNMTRAIEKSCNTYFYTMAHRVGYDAIAPVAKAMGLGQEFDLPGTNQRYGTVPDSAWKMRRYQQRWSVADSLNATIGQGYVSVSPLQLAVMAARIATGRNIVPQLLLSRAMAAPGPLPYPAEMFAVPRAGMAGVMQPGGTGARSRLLIPNVQMAGKTGTAQVRALVNGRNAGSNYKSRDHGLFVCFCPVEQPRYAAAVVIEHGMGGARAAAPVAKDVLTFLYDREAAMASLLTLEAGWGGTMAERLQRRYASYQAEAGLVPTLPVPPDAASSATNNAPVDAAVPIPASGDVPAAADPAPGATPAPPASPAGAGAGPPPAPTSTPGGPA